MRYLMRYLTIIITVLSVSVCVCGCKPAGAQGQSEVGSPDASPGVLIEVDTKDISDEAASSPVPDNKEKEEELSKTENEAPRFTAEEISDEVFERMRGVSFPEDCPVKLSDLRYLRLSYKDMEGNTHEGEMVCNAAIADKLIDIFTKLYENDYPIERMSLVDDYNADDELSMSSNNTSCFNFRYISGTKRISKHGEGLAVDLNPLYNPYVKEKDGTIHVEPESGTEYTDRTLDFDYKIDENDLAYKLFTEAGFTWGGSWKSVKDYQHFEYDPK